MTPAAAWGLRGCRGFGRDPLWWAALLGGPVFWLLWAQWHPPARAALPLVFWFSVVLWQPVLEELFFRGFLQGRFLRQAWGARRLGGISAANALTALIFALFHLLQHSPFWAAAVFIPGLLFGCLRERSGCIYAPFALHAFYNLGYFLLWPP